MRIVVGLRGSKLSLTQAETVIQRLKASVKDLEVEKEIIKTTGDVVTGQHILSIKSEGVFEKEVNRAVAEEKVDFAIHSMKDLPNDFDPSLVIAAVPPRESPHDTIVTKEGYSIQDIPAGSTIGTGSPRREAQIRYVRPDLKIEPIRGNVDTRLRKLDEGLYDAVLLAEAGLNRLEINSKMKRLPLEDFTPTPGQGALAVTVRKDRKDLLKIFSRIDHQPSRVETTAERVFLAKTGGGCKVPIGAVARLAGDVLTIHAMVVAPDGSERFYLVRTGDADDPEALGGRVADEMLREAGRVVEMVRRVA
ncbi:MAG: hydroxymethylbilane synthase [Thaumarchaeota archaeon]|nr:hydroxymethylbilane synthase [Nitrososphaerota archaeon]